MDPSSMFVGLVKTKKRLTQAQINKLEYANKKATPTVQGKLESVSKVDSEDKKIKANKAANKKNKTKKKKDTSKAPKHLFSDFPNAGMLSKDGVYAENGYCYFEKGGTGKGGGDRSRLYSEARSAMFAFAWFGPRNATWLAKNCSIDTLTINFNPTLSADTGISAQEHPYTWEAHHILPGNCFYRTSDGGAFSPEQRDILLKVPYDINHGENMIFLPGKRTNHLVPVHGLLQHYCSHTGYDVLVKNSFKTEVANKLQDIIDKQEKCKQTLDNKILDVLINLQQDYWDDIVDSSASAVTNVILGEKTKPGGMVKKSSQGVFPRIG